MFNLVNNFFYTPRPFEDFTQKKSYIFWGTRSKIDPEQFSIEIEKLRPLIIETNFTSNEPLVYKLGELKFKEKETKSKWSWKVLSSTIKVIHQEHAIGKELLIAATYFFFATAVGVYSFWLGQILIGAGSIGCGIGAILLLKESFSQAFSILQKVQKAYTDPYIVFQELQHRSSSNHSATQEGFDIFSQTPIPLAVMRAPRTLKIGSASYFIVDVLKFIFENTKTPLTIRYPDQADRALTPEEKDHFVKSLRNFFCISKKPTELFEYCWGKLTEQDFQPLYQHEKWRKLILIPKEKAGLEKAWKLEFGQTLFPLKCMQRFFHLIPYKIRKKYFATWRISVDSKLESTIQGILRRFNHDVEQHLQNSSRLRVIPLQEILRRFVRERQQNVR